MITVPVLGIFLLIGIGSNALSLIWAFNVPACIIIPMLIVALGYVIVLLPFGLAFFLTSYMRITPDGIDYNVLPAMRYRCQWHDLEYLSRLNSYDVIYLKQAEVKGSFFWTRFYRAVSPTGNHFLSLTVFDEWPEGELASDLRLYAPHLFVLDD